MRLIATRGIHIGDSRGERLFGLRHPQKIFKDLFSFSSTVKKFLSPGKILLKIA
jgi:hypothetical protein